MEPMGYANELYNKRGVASERGGEGKHREMNDIPGRPGAGAYCCTGGHYDMGT